MPLHGWLKKVTQQVHQDWIDRSARYPHIVKTVVALTSFSFGFLLVATIWFVSSLITGLPNREAIDRIGDMNQATTVFDRNDKLAFSIFKEQRIAVPLAQVSPHFVSAIVSVEDQRFFDHHGFDMVRIGAAALNNIRHARVEQGGSTITQQLARQSFLTTDKTLRRKLQELILAERLEAQYSKERILELYLNKVYFGDGLYGVEAASRGYFDKHASDLSISEAALLAGLVKSPSRYAPTDHLDRAVTRRNIVLKTMLDNRIIDQATWQSAKAESVTIRDGLRTEEPFGQYFQEQVRQELVKRFGWERVYEGGLRVYSTIDSTMQRAADHAVASQLKAIDERRKRSTRKPSPTPPTVDQPLQAALLAMDPVSGHVFAMVGGRDFNQSRFNRAVQAKRQPGSAFKPFVYATALESGYTPATVIDRLNDPIATLEGAWTPEDGHSTADSMSLRAALRTSSNRAAVRLLQDVGIPRTVAYAKTMGIGDVPSVPSLALGSGEVTLQSLTAAYAAFANRGLVPEPLLIRRIEERDGTVLFEAKDASHRAVTEQTAYLMASILADVIDAGTGARARSLGFRLPAAGKTGTTNEFRDAWFVGFTPSLVTGVWVGFDEPRTILPNGFAADIAVPLWTAFMKAATKGDQAVWLRAPQGVVAARVCRLSGQLATDRCDDVEVVNESGAIERRSMVYTEFFTNGTQPTEYCELHQSRTIIGAIASIFHGGEQPTPPTLEEAGLPPAETLASVSAAPAPAEIDAPALAPVPERKRGFWSRLFGVGDSEKPKK